MNTRLKSRVNKKTNQADINPIEINNNHKKVFISTTDYFSEWATEKGFLEKPKSTKIGNSVEPISGDSQTPYYDQYY